MLTIEELNKIRDAKRNLVSMRSESAENNSGYKYQVLVCGGTGCHSSGSQKVIDALHEEIAANNLENEELGYRKVPFSKEVYIDRDDFMEEPPKKYFRLFPGNEVRLMNAYFVKCTSFVKDENGKVIEVHATYDPASKGGNSPDGRKVKGTIHWVPVNQAVKCEIRLYENIINEEEGKFDAEGNLNINPNSLTVLKNCYVEPELKDAKAYDSFQFVRQGYFCVDAKDSTEDNLVFNRIVSLKSSFKLNS